MTNPARLNLVPSPCGVQQELFGAWDARRDVVVDEVVLAEALHQPIGARAIDARLPSAALSLPLSELK